MPALYEAALFRIDPDGRLSIVGASRAPGVVDTLRRLLVAQLDPGAVGRPVRLVTPPETEPDDAA